MHFQQNQRHNLTERLTLIVALLVFGTCLPRFWKATTSCCLVLVPILKVLFLHLCMLCHISPPVNMMISSTDFLESPCKARLKFYSHQVRFGAVAALLILISCQHPVCRFAFDDVGRELFIKAIQKVSKKNS